MPACRLHCLRKPQAAESELSVLRSQLRPAVQALSHTDSLNSASSRSLRAVPVVDFLPSTTKNLPRSLPALVSVPISRWNLVYMVECIYYITLFSGVYTESEREVAQSCPTLCGPVDCSPSGSSIHGILQARILEWVAISFSRGSSQPRDRSWVSRIVGSRFYHLATRKS